MAYMVYGETLKKKFKVLVQKYTSSAKIYKYENIVTHDLHCKTAQSKMSQNEPLHRTCGMSTV